jgi:hypothetical protein
MTDNHQFVGIAEMLLEGCAIVITIVAVHRMPKIVILMTTILTIIATRVITIYKTTHIAPR